MRKELAALATIPFAVACGKKESAVVAPVASTLSASTASASSSSGAVWHFAIDHKSTTHVDMPGVTEHIIRRHDGAAGTLDVVPSDLAQSRGVVRIDLSTLSTSTFGTTATPRRPSTRARGSRSWSTARRTSRCGGPTLAMRSIDGLSATDLGEGGRRSGADDVRTVTVTVHGDLLVHGHKVAQGRRRRGGLPLPAGAAPRAEATPTRWRSSRSSRCVSSSRSTTSQPRDTAGRLAAWTTRLISKVAETADVTVNIGALPAPYRARHQKESEVMRPNLSIENLATVLAALGASALVACGGAQPQPGARERGRAGGLPARPAGQASCSANGCGAKAGVRSAAAAGASGRTCGRRLACLPADRRSAHDARGSRRRRPPRHPAASAAPAVSARPPRPPPATAAPSPPPRSPSARPTRAPRPAAVRAPARPTPKPKIF